MSWGSRVGGVNLGHRSRDAPLFFRPPCIGLPAIGRAGTTSDILRNVTPQRLIVAITGATGAIYGVRLLEMLREAGGRNTPRHQPVGPAHAASRNHLHRRSGSAARDGDVCAERSGRGDFERLLSHHGHGDCAVQHAHARVGRARAGRQPHSSRRGRRAQGAAEAAPGSARSAAQRHSPREHAQAVADGSCHLSADARASTSVPNIDELVTTASSGCSTSSASTSTAPGRWGEEFALGVTGKIPPDDSESY